MSVSFDPRGDLVVVESTLWGPKGIATLRMALDTGSTSTLVNAGPLVFLGYDPTDSAERVQLATGSRVESAPQLVVDRIDALEQNRLNFRVVCHTLPVSTRLDGLLGLDFMRDQSLRIDFRKGEITLR
jgi:hypothetical protein